MFFCNLPPALLAEWPGSFTCYFGNAGVERIPTWLDLTQVDFIASYCRDNPMERLGYGRGGIREIQKHTWFESFNWDGLRSRSLKAPIVPAVSRLLKERDDFLTLCGFS